MTPDFATFKRYAEKGNVIPVYRSVLADLLTPVSAYLRLARGRRYAFLLESVEGGEHVGRYTFLGADPFMIVRARGDEVEIETNGRKRRKSGHLLDALRDITSRYQAVPLPGLP